MLFLPSNSNYIEKNGYVEITITVFKKAYYI